MQNETDTRKNTEDRQSFIIDESNSLFLLLPLLLLLLFFFFFFFFFFSLLPQLLKFVAALHVLMVAAGEVEKVDGWVDGWMGPGWRRA